MQELELLKGMLARGLPPTRPPPAASSLQQQRAAVEDAPGRAAAAAAAVASARLDGFDSASNTMGAAAARRSVAAMWESLRHQRDGSTAV